MIKGQKISEGFFSCLQICTPTKFLKDICFGKNISGFQMALTKSGSEKATIKGQEILEGFFSSNMYLRFLL